MCRCTGLQFSSEGWSVLLKAVKRTFSTVLERQNPVNCILHSCWADLYVHEPVYDEVAYICLECSGKGFIGHMFGVFCHSCGFLDSCSWPSRCETETFERTTRKIDFILESFDGHPSSIAIVLRFDDLQELVAKHAAPDVMGQCQKRSSKPFFP